MPGPWTRVVPDPEAFGKPKAVPTWPKPVTTSSGCEDERPEIDSGSGTRFTEDETHARDNGNAQDSAAHVERDTVILPKGNEF